MLSRSKKCINSYESLYGSVDVAVCIHESVVCMLSVKAHLSQMLHVAREGPRERSGHEWRRGCAACCRRSCALARSQPAQKTTHRDGIGVKKRRGEEVLVLALRKEIGKFGWH